MKGSCTASSSVDFETAVHKLGYKLWNIPNSYPSKEEDVRADALELRKIVDEVFGTDSPDLNEQKAEALMFAMECVVFGSTGGKKDQRNAKIFEAAKRIFRATTPEELELGKKDLQDA